MAARIGVILVVLAACVSGVAADETVYRYEGDVSPCDPSAGWICGNPCEDECSDSVEDGHYVLRWFEPNDIVGYGLWIAEPPAPPPPTLWIEWRFRSNHPIGPNFYSCDGGFAFGYDRIFDSVSMYGDAVIRFGGNNFVFDLNIEEFHTYRFESTDGVSYRVSVDGLIFINASDNKNPEAALIQMGGRGACDGFVNTVNEWDFVRYGTIATGEQIIAADPPAGFVAPQVYPGLDRFTVTFDSPNYVYIGDVSVSVSGGIRPNVIQTLRRENTEPDTVEIVLDRPMPLNETTTFTITDGTATGIVEYTVRIPVPATSTWGLATFALLLLAAATLVIKRQAEIVVSDQLSAVSPGAPGSAISR